MNGQKFDMAPHIAGAISRSEEAYKKADAFFRLNRAACVAAARKSDFWRHPLIDSGRAELTIKARRALGVMACDKDCTVTRSCLQAGFPDIWRKVRDAREIDIPSIYLAKMDGLTDTQVMDRLAVTMITCALMGKYIPPTQGNLETQQLLLSFDFYAGKHGINKLSESVPIAEARNFFPASMTPGITGLSALFGLEPYERADTLADHLGVGIAALTDDIKLTDADRRAILFSADGDTEEAQRLALLALILKAIKKDKDFCMQEYRDDKLAEIDIAKAEAKKAREDLKEAHKKAEKIQSDLDAAIRKIETLQKEIDSCEGDRQELAALRSALYRADTPEDVHVEQRVREVPEGIISLGGADPWLIEMRKRFPSIKFIAPDQSFADADLRGASEIWFQAGYIAHKQYYKAIATARAYGVPVRYFSSTGAGRCAEDLVRID